MMKTSSIPRRASGEALASRRVPVLAAKRLCVPAVAARRFASSSSKTSSSTSTTRKLQRLQASSAASFVSRNANDEEDEEDEAVPVSSKSLTEAAASARATADAAVAAAADAEESASMSSATTTTTTSRSALASVAHALGVLHRFSRPHTMAGTTISILSVSALALVRIFLSWIFRISNFFTKKEEEKKMTMGATTRKKKNSKKKKLNLEQKSTKKKNTKHQSPADLSARVAAALATALVSALLMNVCIVGINQVYDVDIDAISKPHLPIPAGDLSLPSATKVCAACGVASLAVGALSGSAPLLLTLAGSLALGFAYSADLPLLRWKRYPAVAAACIIAIRTVAVQAGFYSHARLSAGLPVVAASTATASLSALPLPLSFAVAMMLAFSVGIAILKDTPDTDGDESAGVRTLSVRLGPRAILAFGSGMLLAAYAAACVVSATTQAPGVRRTVLVGGHAVAAALLARAASGVDSTSRESITKFYMFIWKLFYAEYLLIPLMR